MGKKTKSNKDTAPDPLALRDGLEFMAEGTLVQLRVDQQLATVFLDSYESSCINLLDPRDLEFEYMQQMTAAVDTFLPDQPVKALHLGGCACALALAWDFGRPGSEQTVVELNGELAQAMRHIFKLPRAPRLKIRVDDAFEAIRPMGPDRFDVVVRDVFTGAQVPSNLRSDVFFESALRTVRPGGLVLVNCIHGPGVDARVDCAAALETFAHMAVVSESKVLNGGRQGNVMIVGYKPAGKVTTLSSKWDDFQRRLRKLPLPSKFLTRAQTKRWVASTPAISLGES